MEFIKYFNQLSEYTADKENFTYPTVSYVEENKEVYYTQKPPILTYTTTGASQQVRLVNKQEYLDYVKVLDTGEELSVTGTGALNYTFENPGEHQVELKFKDDATTLENAFGSCTELTSIPESLFSNNTAVTSFSITFNYCTGLTSIPENLFKYNTAVTDFVATFQDCSGLTNIPESLFANNTAVTSFIQTFFYCSGLTNIPENLFGHNTSVTSFNNTFTSCTGLTSIPANLFKYNTAVTDFSNTFYNCSGLTGNVPTDTDDTPLYNRSTPGKEGYAVVTNYGSCFGNCTGLTDYSSIPSSWK